MNNDAKKSHLKAIIKLTIYFSVLVIGWIFFLASFETTSSSYGETVVEKYTYTDSFGLTHTKERPTFKNTYVEENIPYAIVYRCIGIVIMGGTGIWTYIAYKRQQEKEKEILK